MPIMQETLGKRLQEARFRKGWSRADVVKATNDRISEAGLRKIEKDDSKPFPQTVYILAAALDLDPQELLACEEAAS